MQKNKEFSEILKTYTEFINKKAEESGLLPTQEAKGESKESALTSTVKFNLSEEVAGKIAS